MNQLLKLILCCFLASSMACHFVIAQSPRLNVSKSINVSQSDSLKLLMQKIDDLENRLANNTTNDKINEKVLGARQDLVIDFAGKIIDWSAMFFGVFVVIITIAGFVAARRFSKLDEARKELDALLLQTQKEINEKLNELADLRIQFDEERENSLKILFPIVEGEWFLYQGEYERAITAYREAHKIKPNHPRIFDKLNKLLIDNGQIDEAIINLEKVRENDPENIRALQQLGKAYRRKHQYEKAIPLLEKCLRIDPRYAPAEHDLGSIFLFQKKFEIAEEKLLSAHRHAIDYSGKPTHWNCISLAITQQILGKKEASLKNFKVAERIIAELLAKTPQNPDLLAYLGIVQLSSGEKQYQEALQLFQKAISLKLPFASADSMRVRLELMFPDSANGIIKTINDLLENRLNEIDILS